MTETNPEKILSTTREVFAWALAKTLDQTVGRSEADRLRDGLSQDPCFQSSLSERISNIPYKDDRFVVAQKAAAVNGELIKLVARRSVADAKEVFDTARSVIDDPDFPMHIMDMCRERGIEELKWIGHVFDFSRSYVKRTVGCVYMITLWTDVAKAQQAGVPSDSLEDELAFAGWTALEHRLGWRS